MTLITLLSERIRKCSRPRHQPSLNLVSGLPNAFGYVHVQLKCFHPFYLWCSLVPRPHPRGEGLGMRLPLVVLTWEKIPGLPTPTQLQCLCSGAWEPGNDAESGYQTKLFTGYLPCWNRGFSLGMTVTVAWHSSGLRVAQTATVTIKGLIMSHPPTLKLPLQLSH